MRESAVRDFRALMSHYGLISGMPRVIDVGGTETVYLDDHNAPNPLVSVFPKVDFLDKGFASSVLNTSASFELDFLDREQIAPLMGEYDIAVSFDTLEHVPDPFKFCEHLLAITRPGGTVFIATVFEWGYHPSPEDYFRFSPAGLRECFTSARNGLREEAQVLSCGWGSDRRGVCLLCQRCTVPTCSRVPVKMEDILPAASPALSPPPAVVPTWRRFLRRARRVWRTATE